jgi:hypothetical protein
MRFNNFTTTMKIHSGPLSLVCVLACTFVQAPAQISITATDVDSTFAAGKIVTQFIDTLTSKVNIGYPGPVTSSALPIPGETSWDFSALHAHKPTVLASVDPRTTPYSAQYPGATHALRTIQTVSLSGNPVLVTVYQYLNLGQNLLNPGNMGGGSVSTPFGSIPGTIQTTIVPAEITYALPSTLGTSWTSSFTETFVAKLSTLVLQSSVTSHTVSHVVDAFGLMTMPGGWTQQALRVRNEDRTPAGKKVSYTFLSKNGALVQIGTCDTTLPNSGIIPVCSISWMLGDTTHDVPVPIQLVRFGATYIQQHGDVQAEWSTMSEVNNYGFYVQRGRQRDLVFTDIPGSFVPGHGTTNVPQHYTFIDKTPQSDARLYRLRQIDLDGSVHYSESVELDGVMDVKQVIPSEFALEQNYPNPFNPSTEISYEIAGVTDHLPASGQAGGSGTSNVKLIVYDLLGREVAVLVNERKAPGRYTVIFDASGLTSGVYFYRLHAGDFVATKKFSLIH